GSSSQGGAGSGASGPAANVASTTGVGTGGGGGSPCSITSASGHVYYVDQNAPGADDGNPGTKAQPWKTIQAAGNVVGAGDTVVVEPGTYAGAIFCWDDPHQGPYSTIAGTSSAPIVIEADPTAPDGSVVVHSKNAKTAIALDLEPGCDYVDLVGFTVQNDGTVTKAGVKVSGSQGNRILDMTVDGVGGIGGIFVDGVTDVLIQGNTVTNTQGSGTRGHGMYLSGSSTNVTVLYNLIHHNQYVGIHVNGDISEGGRGTVVGATIAGNVIHDNGQNGINCDGIQDSVFVNDVIYDNARNGIELYQIDALGGSTGNVVVDCSIDQSNHGSAIEIAPCAYDNQGSAPTPPGCQGAPFDTSTGNVAFDSVLLGASGATSVVSNADLSTSHDLTSASPSPFVDAAHGDYHLAPGGPGAGTGVASFGGANAPADAGAYDIGAFDFGLVKICP
ncbi:MAG TPA: right-handed parallel beta-helix repeat-containing protein, partial [Minicystis sp.]|nr:right-handed parallel beta-helix repeat-containing protein [Minicystis sp.]